MIKEDYCSYEVAKLLKEKGFDEPCTELNKLCLRDGEKPVLKVTHQKAMKWLREVRNIKINIWYNDSNYAIEYFEPNTQTGVGKFVFIGDGYYAYEDAVEAALKYSLENLV